MKLRRFTPKHQKNSLFFKVMIAVGFLMGALLVLAGGIMVTNAVLPQETEFEAVPPSQQNSIEPKKQKIKVITKNVQKRSVSLVKRINVLKPQQINTPQVEITLPSGLGGEGSDGFASFKMDGAATLNKLKIELPEHDLFGLKTSSDRVLICFDAARRTMSDDMGGLEAYNIVKAEILRLVKNLPSTVLFNVIVFDHSRSYFRPGLVMANSANKQSFEAWLSPINSDISEIGLGRLPASELKYKTPPRLTNKLLGDLAYPGDWFQGLGVYPVYDAYQAAIEQGAGSIYFLTAAWFQPKDFLMRPSDSEISKYKSAVEKKKKDFLKKGGTFVEPAVHEALIRAADEAGKRFVDAENEKRKAQGKPLWVDHGYYFQVAIRQNLPEGIALNGKELESKVMVPWKFKGYTMPSLYAAYGDIFKKVYADRNLPKPNFNMILLLPKTGEGEIKKNEIAAARAWVKQNGKGNVRILRGAKPVSEYK